MDSLEAAVLWLRVQLLLVVVQLVVVGLLLLLLLILMVHLPVSLEEPAGVSETCVPAAKRRGSCVWRILRSSLLPPPAPWTVPYGVETGSITAGELREARMQLCVRLRIKGWNRIVQSPRGDHSRALHSLAAEPPSLRLDDFVALPAVAHAVPTPAVPASKCRAKP